MHMNCISRQWGDNVLYNIQDIIEKLRGSLPQDRFSHSINVMNISSKLAGVYKIDCDDALTAGLLHDCARGMNGEELLSFCIINGINFDKICRRQPILLHGIVGVEIAKRDYGVFDEGILDAILTHTMGSDCMSDLQKIVYVADMIEPERIYEGVDKIRKAAYQNLDKAMIMCCNASIAYIIQKKQLIHPDTISTRNSLIDSKYMLS